MAGEDPPEDVIDVAKMGVGLHRLIQRLGRDPAGDVGVGGEMVTEAARAGFSNLGASAAGAAWLLTGKPVSRPAATTADAIFSMVVPQWS